MQDTQFVRTESKRVPSRNKKDLQILSYGTREIIMTRAFNALSEEVFQALTTPELITRWLLGPTTGWSMPVCKVDLRVGGMYRYVWKHRDGREMGVSGIYRRIVKPGHLVHSERFDNPWYPGESLISTVLTDEGNITKFMCTMLYESREARNMVLDSDMDKGISASFDRLDALFVE